MYSGTLIADLQEKCDRMDALVAFLLVQQKQKELAKICGGCGCKLGDHRGHDAACPYPYRFEKGQPLYIEGQFFTETLHRCEALLTRHAEDEGRLCGKQCSAGKFLCDKHYIE
jgi:hypothetical protein